MSDGPRVEFVLRGVIHLDELLRVLGALRRIGVPGTAAVSMGMAASGYDGLSLVVPAAALKAPRPYPGEEL